MKKIKLFPTAILCLSLQPALAQNPESVRSYINTYKDIAMEEMKRTGVPAAIKIAQGIHETDAGNSDLVKKSSNHFGIKCKSVWTGQSVKHDDDARNECFRKYNSASDSYQDHSNFLKNSQRYAFLFELDPTDYQGWALGLKKAGYATNPRYSQVLIKIIEEYQLQDYTLIALGKMTPKDDAIAKRDVEVVQPKSGPVFADIMPELPQLQKIAEQQPFYPQGEFKIYETKVVYVNKGTSFLSIAEQYNIPLAHLFEFNDLTESEITEKDQLVYIQRKRKTGNNEFHIVKPGESLHDIAQEQAIRFESLLEYNMLTQKMQPASGEKLYLKYKAPAPPKLTMKDNYSFTNFKENAGH